MNCLHALGPYRDDVKLHNTKRIDLEELHLQIVIRIDSVQNVTDKATQGTESGIESEILLPSSTCTVSSYLSCKQFVDTLVNKKYYFSKDDLTIVKIFIR